MASSETKTKGEQTTADNNALAGEHIPRLCYVDDSRTSAYVVKRMLRPYGYVVDHYDSAEPALVALVQKHYDLLLTDLKVSPKGMDGDDLVRALRNSGSGNISNMPIIVITGSTDSTVLNEVYEAGADHILTKPVNGEELNSQIRKLVSENPMPIRTAEEMAQTSEADISELIAAATGNKATVVPFDAESKFVDSVAKADFDVDEALSEVDAIPVLSPAEPSLERQHIKERALAMETEAVGADVETDHADAEEEMEIIVLAEEHGDDAQATTMLPPQPLHHSSRRVLNGGKSTSLEFATGDANGERYIPQPKSPNIPAAKVKPSVVVKPSASPDQTPRDATMAARQEAARRAKAAILAAQQKQSRVVKAEMEQGPTEASEALKKLKAAAARKAMLAKKQKAIEAAKAARAAKEAMAARAAAAAAAKAKKQSQLETDHLSLEPLDDEVVDPFSTHRKTSFFHDNRSVEPEAVSREYTAASAEPNSAAESPRNEQPQSPPELIHPQDGGKVEHKPAPERLIHPHDLPRDQQGQPTNLGNSILQEIERFPLVEADLTEHYASSRAMSALTSIFELYGLKKILIMAGLILVAFFSWGSWSEVFDDGVPVELAVVEQGEIFQAMTYPGKVVSKQKVDVVPSIAGRLTEIMVDEGDSVKKGDLMARLDDREAKSFLTKANASLNSAKEDVLLAERTLERLSQAFKKGAVARQLVEDAEVDLRSAKARESIAEEEVRSAKMGLENPRIIAPFSGVVTARFVEVGQWVVPSETLFTLIDPKQREIEVKVDAADSGGIAVGQTVGLSSDAFPGLEWSESVTRLAAATSNVGNANTISVYISLGANAPSLRFGQQVDADIRTAWNPNAIKVPFGSLLSKDGQSYVAVLDGDKARLVAVTTGIEDFSHVEITQGLAVGESIILANGKRLRDGERVRIASE